MPGSAAHVDKRQLERLSLFRYQLRRFLRFSDDKFFIAIEARDPKYDPQKTRELLERTGALHIEEVED